MQMSRKVKQYCMEVAIRADIHVTDVTKDGQEIVTPDYEYVFLNMTHEEIAFVEQYWKSTMGVN